MLFIQFRKSLHQFCKAFRQMHQIQLILFTTTSAQSGACMCCQFVIIMTASCTVNSGCYEAGGVQHHNNHHRIFGQSCQQYPYSFVYFQLSTGVSPGWQLSKISKWKMGGWLKDLPLLFIIHISFIKAGVMLPLIQDLGGKGKHRQAPLMSDCDSSSVLLPTPHQWNGALEEEDFYWTKRLNHMGHITMNVSNVPCAYFVFLGFL